MSSAATQDGVFELKRKEDPTALTAIRTREEVCDDPELSDGSVRLFVRLLDMALNPALNNNRRGQVIVSQMKLASLLHCDERSIRRRTDELVRKNFLWTTLIPRPNTKPILCYHVTAFQEKKQVEQEIPGDGLWGNGHRRMDSGFARTGIEATGHKRRMGSLLLDAFGKPISSNFLENTPVTGQKRRLSADNFDRSERTLASSATGQNCPVTPARVSAVTGQTCPLTPDNSDRSLRTPASDYKESQNRDLSGFKSKGAQLPPKIAQARASNEDLALAEWRQSLNGRYPSQLEKLKARLIAQRDGSKAPNVRQFIGRKIKMLTELLDGPVPEPEQEPAAPRPARKAPQIEELNGEALLESARIALSMGVKVSSLTVKQREALKAAGELK